MSSGSRIPNRYSHGQVRKVVDNIDCRGARVQPTAFTEQCNEVFQSGLGYRRGEGNRKGQDGIHNMYEPSNIEDILQWSANSGSIFSI